MIILEKNILEKVRERSLANPFPRYIHIQLSTLERDHAEVYVDMASELTNYAGVFHGGVLFTMADYCATTTARTDGRKYVTLDADCHYIKNTNSGRITASGKVVHRGESSTLVDVEIHSEDRKLLFTSRLTLFCLGEYAD